MRIRNCSAALLVAGTAASTSSPVTAAELLEIIDPRAGGVLAVRNLETVVNKRGAVRLSGRH